MSSSLTDSVPLSESKQVTGNGNRGIARSTALRMLDLALLRTVTFTVQSVA